MTDQLISLDTAELAKEKGFDVNTLHFYDRIDMLARLGFHELNHNSSGYCKSAPTQSLLQKWLRTKGIHIELIIDGWDDDLIVRDPYYRAFIWQIGQPKPGPADDIGGAEYERILESVLTLSNIPGIILGLGVFFFESIIVNSSK